MELGQGSRWWLLLSPPRLLSPPKHTPCTGAGQVEGVAGPLWPETPPVSKLLSRGLSAGCGCSPEGPEDRARPRGLAVRGPAPLFMLPEQALAWASSPATPGWLTSPFSGGPVRASQPHEEGPEVRAPYGFSEARFVGGREPAVPGPSARCLPSLPSTPHPSGAELDWGLSPGRVTSVAESLSLNQLT